MKKPPGRDAETRCSSRNRSMGPGTHDAPRNTIYRENGLPGLPGDWGNDNR